jgi:hypothetical protein
MFPDQRYYFLMDFYKHMPAKPWWYGSIPLASVDFLWQMRTAKEQATRAVELDPMVARHERERALAAVESANNQDDYLRSLPNSVNYTLPNLMLFKLRVLGVPTSGGLAYLLAAVAIGCAGAAGIRRCVALEMENGNVADYV